MINGLALLAHWSVRQKPNHVSSVKLSYTSFTRGSIHEADMKHTSCTHRAGLITKLALLRVLHVSFTSASCMLPRVNGVLIALYAPLIIILDVLL